MKKLFAVLLAVAMLLSLGVTAFAADTGKITVANAPEDTMYVAYKVFDAEYDDQAEEVVYTLTSDSPWFDTLVNEDGTSKFEGLKYVKQTEASNAPYIVIKETGFKVSDFADYLKAAVVAGEIDQDPVLSAADPSNDSTQVIQALPGGYYLVLPIEAVDVDALQNDASHATTEITKTGDKYDYNGGPDDLYITTDAFASAEDEVKPLYDSTNSYMKITRGETGSETTSYLPKSIYDGMPDDQKDAGDTLVYKRLDSIEDGTFKGLVSAKNTAEIVKYTPQSNNFSLTATEAALNQGEYNELPAQSVMDLYETVKYGEADETAGTIPEGSSVGDNVPFYYLKADASKMTVIDKATFDDLDATTQALYDPGVKYQLKSKIAKSQFTALNTADDNDTTADPVDWMVKYAPMDEVTDTTTTLTSIKTSDVIFKPADTFVPVLTTVLDGKNIQVQNKNDMPLDKTVKKDDGTGAMVDVNNEGVNVGDELNYSIDTVIPPTSADEYTTIFRIWDKMATGLTLKDNKITITIEGDNADLADIVYELTYIEKTGDTYDKRAQLKETKDGVDSTDFELVTDRTQPLTGYQVRFYEDRAQDYTFEVSLPAASELLKKYEGHKVHITYIGVVNETAVAELLDNVANLTYTDENGNLWEKDIETDNYISRILIDKFETGNRTQKLPGAKFQLYKLDTDGTTKLYYQLKGVKHSEKAAYEAGDTTTAPIADVISEVWFTDDSGNRYDHPLVKNADGTIPAPAEAVMGDDGTTVVTAAVPEPDYYEDLEVEFVAAPATFVITDANGFAQFGYLEDGTYYLEEVQAPVDYAKLLGPIEFEVDGSAATDHSLNDAQRVDALTNIANVENTPGSSLPSTGGVGATMMTIGGVALILAAGAFLVLRRRKEQE